MDGPTHVLCPLSPVRAPARAPALAFQPWAVERHGRPQDALREQTVATRADRQMVPAVRQGLESSSEHCRLLMMADGIRG